MDSQKTQWSNIYDNCKTSSTFSSYKNSFYVVGTGKRCTIYRVEILHFNFVILSTYFGSTEIPIVLVGGCIQRVTSDMWTFSFN